MKEFVPGEWKVNVHDLQKVAAGQLTAGWEHASAGCTFSPASVVSGFLRVLLETTETKEESVRSPSSMRSFLPSVSGSKKRKKVVSCIFVT